MQHFGMKIQVSQNLRFTKLSHVSKKLVLKIVQKQGEQQQQQIPKSHWMFCKSFVKNPHIFTHRTAQKYQIDQKSVCKILKQNKFHIKFI